MTLPSKLTAMPYNHRVRDGVLECAYVSSAPLDFATNYVKWLAGPNVGKAVIDRFGNATCAGCLRDVPAPSDQPTAGEYE